VFCCRHDGANGCGIVWGQSQNSPGILKDKLPTLTDPFVHGEVDPHKSQEGTGLACRL
jgi:hypothetical protein